MGFLQGKRALIVGLASNRSIAWGIAQAMHREGAELAFTFQNEKLEGRVIKMANELGSDIVLPCDVSSDEQIDAVFSGLGKQWDGLDCIITPWPLLPKKNWKATTWILSLVPALIWPTKSVPTASQPWPRPAER